MPTSRSIGNGLLTTGVRTYKVKDMSLVAWSQRQCLFCGCFLRKTQRKYCEKHGTGSKEYFLLNKERYHTYNKKWREANLEHERERHNDYNKKHRACFREHLSYP